MPDRPILCFGELLLRLTPPDKDLLLRSRLLEVHVGGAEANVGVALAGLDHHVRIVSALPDDAIGRHVLAEMRAGGVDTSAILVRPGRMGLYFSSPGASARAPEVKYDRAGSVFAQLEADAFDWDILLAGARRLHLSGITPALGSGPAKLALSAAKAATRLAVPLSFDGNYRAKLWEGRRDEAGALLFELISHADILFGNHRDVSLLLGQSFSGRSADDRRQAAEGAFAAFPRLRLMASTARTVDDPLHHRISARIDTPDHAVETDEIMLSGIVERIGGGDAFAAGVLHGLGREWSDIDVALRIGLAMTSLKHSLPGDARPVSEGDIKSFWSGELEVRR